MKKVIMTILLAVSLVMVVTGCVYRAAAPNTNSQPQPSQSNSGSASNSSIAPSSQSEPSSSQISTAPQEVNLSEEQAKKIALQKVPGASESNISVHLDYEDGRRIYEGAIVYENIKYEFEIDAVSGSILSWEQESVFDD